MLDYKKQTDDTRYVSAPYKDDKESDSEDESGSSESSTSSDDESSEKDNE